MNIEAIVIAFFMVVFVLETIVLVKALRMLYITDRTAKLIAEEKAVNEIKLKRRAEEAYKKNQELKKSKNKQHKANEKDLCATITNWAKKYATLELELKEEKLLRSEAERKLVEVKAKHKLKRIPRRALGRVTHKRKK